MEFVDWGLIPYPEATEKQLQLVDSVASGKSEDTIVFCTHPPVVTLGRSSTPEDLTGWQGDVFETSRGGRATYHGPEQLVIYPIINLTKERENLKPRDVHQYLRQLEQGLIGGLKEFGVNAEIRETKEIDAQGKELLMTGVWVGDHKLASIGIAVRKWVTYHGAALNLTKSDTAFSGIQPCGFKKDTMTSLKSIQGQEPDLQLIRNCLKSALKKAFI